jgi:hypothetical protein
MTRLEMRCIAVWADMEPGHRVIWVTFSNRVTPGHQYDPVLAFFRAIFVLCFSLYSVNNRKSAANIHCYWW